MNLLRLKHKVSFHKIRGITYGHVILEDKHITIDLTKNTNPLRTYIHELLHLKFPSKNEKEIYKLEIKTWKQMSATERLRMYRKLFQ